MEKWQKISLLLCTFGFFRELRPSESYVIDFLSGDWRNLTSEQVTQVVYPFGTYAQLVQLVVVIVVTDLLRYKPVIVFSSIAGIILFSILLWTRKLWELLIGQVFFGSFMAAEVAYFTYIYAKVDRVHYQKVTGHTRAGILFGKFLGATLAQVLISTNSMNSRELHYISFGTQILSLPLALALPSVPRSVYFYSSDSPDQSQVTSGETKIPSTEVAPKFSLKNATRLLWSHLVSSYTNPIVLQWSIWWALATCGWIQTVSYVQFLWKELATNDVSNYNGAAAALATLLGTVGAMAAGQLNSNNRRSFYMIINSLGAAVLGAIVIYAGVTTNIWVAYAIHVIFSALFFFMVTVGAAIVAANVVPDSFGLVFGVNNLVALLLQTVFTIITVTESGFALSPRKQYTVYGSYYLGLAAVFLIVLGCSKLCCKTKQDANPKLS